MIKSDRTGLGPLIDKLDTALRALSDVRCSLRVHKEDCKTCGATRYNDFEQHQAREACSAASNRIEKAKVLLEGMNRGGE